MKKLCLLLVLAAQPAFAASGPFFSLHNTNFVVAIAFILFVGLVLKLKVPARLARLLDARAEGIKSELDEARALREEAQSILASYERKSRDVQAQADAIVASAKREAHNAAEQAKADLEQSIERRLKTAQEQLDSAEAQALRAIKDQAVAVAIAAAGDVLSKQLTPAAKAGLLDASINDVKARLN